MSHRWRLAGGSSPQGLRDFAGLREYDFAAYCAGEATRGAATAVIPTDDVERAIGGAQQVQRADAGLREQIATARLGRRRGSGVRESDDNRRDDDNRKEKR